MLVDGYFRVGRLAGVDLRLHWSVPVGALVFGSLRFEPILWLAFFAVILVHELGHALMVRSVGCRVTGLDMTGFGGQCRWRGKPDALGQAIIAWGGVAAQTLLLVATLLVIAFSGHAKGHAGSLVEHAFVEVNLWIIAINLLPFPPLDGARAWQLFSELGARGWTLPRLALYPIWRWAAQRRQRRVERAGPSTLEPSEMEPSVARPTPQRRPSPVPAGSEAADADRGGDDDLLEKPSAQAQRELAALLERIGDEAGRAKKRR
ncbi:MAG TPA: M50 family metallopeptidase [Polyangiaceae bacterium]|nr:M50 family metallopeptidase [Polyangiaceae bacterium]